MTEVRISEVARRTGVPATTLRYYEDIGLLAPAARSGNGYRTYSERDVERLRFVTRAKQLDLGLDDVRELLAAWDSDDCAGVQQRMADVVEARLAQAQERIVALTELSDQLRLAVRRLSVAPRAGGCDDGCACSTATSPLPAQAGPPAVPVPVVLGLRPDATDEPVEPPRCSLDRDLLRGRVDDWRSVLDRATGREPLPGGVAVTFAHDPAVTVALASLAAAEHACCTFFDFTLRVDAAGVRLEVRAPDDAQHLLASVFGGTPEQRPL